MSGKKGFHKIDGLVIPANPCAQTAFERGLVRGAKFGFNKGFKTAKKQIITEMQKYMKDKNAKKTIE